METEGVIKFELRMIEDETISGDHPQVAELLLIRQEMHKLAWIGVDREQIGYGNASVRIPGTGILITGTQTGHLRVLEEEHLALVTNWKYGLDDSFSITYSGKCKPSSESITHAAIYDAHPEVQAVLHLHHSEWWILRQRIGPYTPHNISYGTSVMASAVAQLLTNEAVYKKGILAMGGHAGGILGWGASAEIALMNLIDIFRRDGFQP